MAEIKPNVKLHPIEASLLHARRERVFLIFAGLFLGTMTMLNILGISRFITLYEFKVTIDETTEWSILFAIAIGVLPYPITFLCTDFISEFYGRRRANWVVMVGLMLNLWVVFILWLGGVLPGFEPIEGAFYNIRALAFGAVGASMAAYLAAQLCDVYMFHFWKRVTRGKYLWIRNNGSTMISQLVDTVAVILITHYATSEGLPIQEGVPEWLQLSAYIATGYSIKFAVAAFDTIPFYIGVHYLKGYLEIDPVKEHARDWEVTK